MEAVKCPSCGASGTGHLCTYCGTQLRSIDEESAALDEYLELVRNAEDKQLEDLLTHGFIPTSEENLIKAGLACVPLLDSDLAKDDGDPAEGAVKRIRTIVSRLKITGESEKSRKAAEELEHHVEQYLRTTKRETLLGCILLTFIAAGIMATILWIAL